MSEIQGASNTKTVVYGILTLRPRMGEPGTRVAFGVLAKLAIPALLGTTLIDRFVKSIHPVERKTVLHHSPPVHCLLVYKAKNKAEKNASDIPQNL